MTIPSTDTVQSATEDHLTDLVQRFSVALLEKLRAAEKKYGYNDGWRNDRWEWDLRNAIFTHLLKGDPRDVAAYCAFAWHHGWPVNPNWADPGSTIDRYTLQSELTRAREREKELALDAERYRYLRNRPEDTIGKGGVFAGMTPPTGSGGHILTEDDLDRAVDRALAGGKP